MTHSIGIYAHAIVPEVDYHTDHVTIRLMTDGRRRTNA
jgi:hypothetical protein